MKTKKVIPIIIVFLLLLGILFFESQTKVFHRWLDEQVYDNYNHYLPCDKLPTEAVVRRVMSENQNLIAKIEAVNPGNVGVELSTPDCPGKADFLIWYSSHQDRIAIQEILIDNYLSGVPVRLQNR